MPFYARVQQLLPEERAIWEQLHRTLGALLACMRRAPQTWQADATYHADLATCLVQVGTALREAGLEAAPFAWETAAVSEHYAHQLLRMGTEATGGWVGRLLMRCAEGPGFFELIRGHVARFAKRLLEASRPDAGCPDEQERADAGLDADLQVEPRHPDGPEAPHWLRWNGKRIRIGIGRSQRSWGLLEYFWRRDSANYEDLCGPDKPWLDSVGDSAIATAVNRFNSEMPFGFPWILATKNRRVYKNPARIPPRKPPVNVQ